VFTLLIISKMLNYNNTLNSLVSIFAIGTILTLDYFIIQEIDKSQLITLNSISIAGIAIICVTLFYYSNKVHQETTKIAPTNSLF